VPNPQQSSSATTPPSTPTAPTTPRTTSTPSTKATQPKSPSSGGVSAQPTTGPSAASSPGTSVKHPAGGSAKARVPATFTVRASGSVSPTSVSAPAFLAVELTVISGDGRPHRVVVQTPGKRALSVPANGRASVLLPGLKAGDYAVELDGAPRAKLVIGGEPGP
jgi:hypothetical protein